MLFPRGASTLDLGEARGSPLPADLDPRVYHQLLVTRRGSAVEVRLDGRSAGRATFDGSKATQELHTERASAAFSGIAVTASTEPLPLGPPEPPVQGWQRHGDEVEQHLLGAERQVYALSGGLQENGSVSVRVQGWALGTSLPVRKYGIQAAGPRGSDRIEAYIDPANGVLATHGWAGGHELPWQNSDLPLGFDYTHPHVLTLQRQEARWRITVDSGSAQERIAALRGPLMTALITEDARAVFSGFNIRAMSPSRRSRSAECVSSPGRFCRQRLKHDYSSARLAFVPAMPRADIA
jgi:hypothetical protein